MMAPKHGDVLFLGNSLLYDYTWSLKDYRTINCSRQGLTLEKFLSLEIENNDFDPVYTVVAFGTVEAVRLKSYVSYDQKSFVQHLMRLNELVSSKWPGSKLIIIAVPPINNHIYKNDYVDPILIEKLNTAISSVFGQPSVEWIDLRIILDTSEHGLTDAMTYDGVHLSEIAYKRWNSELESMMIVHQ